MELVAAYPAAGVAMSPLVAVRASIVSSSMAALRDRGLYDRYREHLGAADGARLVAAVAGTRSHFPLARFAYFRAAYCGVQQAALGLFSVRSYMRILPASAFRESFALRAAWV